MPIECEVIPRARASADDLKALGTALLRWYVRERDRDGVAHSLDTEALVDLLNGRLPPARLKRAPSSSPVPREVVPSPVHLGGYEMRLPDVRRLQAALAAVAEPVAILRVRRWNYERRRVLASLRDYIPAELVQDVRVEGKSWKVDI